MAYSDNFDHIQVVHPSQQYPLQAPNLLNPDAATVLKEEADQYLKTNPIRCFSSQQVRSIYDGGRGIYLSREGKVLLQFGSGHQKQFGRASTFKHLTGKSFLLGRPDSADYYYHWMLDELPRLHYLQQAGISLEHIDHFVVRGFSHDFQIQSLQHTGVDPRKIVVLNDHEEILYDELYYIESGNGLGMQMNKQVPQYLNSLFPQKTGVAHTANRRLFISRPREVRRHVVEQESMLPALQAAGFEVIGMEGLTVEDQVKLFREASIVMSPHGAALTNTVFCRPGTLVCELFGRHVLPFYYGLSAVCGHCYNALLETTDDLPSLISLGNAVNFLSKKHLTEALPVHINLNLVERFLEQLPKESPLTATAA